MTDKDQSARPSEAREFDELRKWESKATPGPWESFDAGAWGGEGAGVKISEDLSLWNKQHGLTCDQGIANSFFITTARRDVPLLLSRVDQLRAQLTEANRRLEIAREGLEKIDKKSCSSFWCSCDRHTAGETLAQISSEAGKDGAGE